MSIDSRSTKTIGTLRLGAQPYFTALIEAVNASLAVSHPGYTIVAISGNRTWAEQDALYAQGRNGDKRKIVTNARGGYSNHNYQIAIDIGVFHNGAYVPESPLYDEVSKIVKALPFAANIEWGGDWQSIQDKPHYQIATGKSVTQLRNLVNQHGMDAMDALIPAFKVPQALPSSDVCTDKIQVKRVTDTGTINIACDAFFYHQRAWVSIRDWATAFGGDVKQVEGIWCYYPNGTTSHVSSSLTLNDRAMVLFADINKLVPFTSYDFDGSTTPRTLTVKP